MINTSSAYKSAVKKNRIFEIFDELVFANGERRTLCKNDFKSYSINEATSESNRFSIGAAVIKKYSASLNNQDRGFDDFDFEGATIAARVGLKLEDGSWEILDKGTYRIVSAKAGELTVEITAYDEMLYFDRPYAESTLEYPATINQIIQDACRCCMVTYDADTVEMGNFSIRKRPEEESVTFRDMISYCAQIMGCFARINHLDTLCFQWYDFSALSRKNIDGGIFDGETPHETGDHLDGGSFTDYQGGVWADGGSYEELNRFHNLYVLGEMSVQTEDIRITGIKITVEETKEEYLQGEEGYVFEISNPLIQSDLPVIAAHIGGKMIGNLFRPLKIKCLSDPCMEAGDAAYVTDRRQNVYQTVITNTTYTMGGYQAVECSAETKTTKEFTRFNASERLLDQASGNTKRKLTSYDVAVQQMNQLAMNAMGFYQTVEEGADGSRITYMHDKPLLEESETVYKQGIDGFFLSRDGGKNYTAGFDGQGNAVLNVLCAIGIVCDWIRGGTLTLGGDSNVNGEMVVYDADGNVVGRFNKDGLWASNGYFEGTVKSKNAEITGGYIDIETSSETQDTILIKYGDYFTNIVPAGINVSNKSYITSQGIHVTTVFSADVNTTSGYHVNANGLSVSGSGLRITAGGINIASGGLEVSGGLDVKTGGIYVDGGNITASSTSKIQINNAGSDALNVAGGALISGKATLSSGAEVSKGLTVNGGATVASGLTVSTGDLKMESSIATFTSEGNAVLKKSLEVSGTATFKGSVKIGGSTSSLIGFFNASGSSKKTVANITTPSSATTSDIATKLNSLLTALRAYGLIG